MKANQAIREAAKAAGVRHWKIAEFLGVSEPTIMRWLRAPLSPEKEKVILEAIDALKKEGC